MQEMQVQSLNQEDPLKKEMATYSSILAWEILWIEEPDGLESIGLQRVRHTEPTIISLQCCVISAAQWSESTICLHISLPSWTFLPPPPHPMYLCHHWALILVPCAVQQVPLGIYFTYDSMYMSILISQFTFPFPTRSTCQFSMSVCILVLWIGSSVPFLQRRHMMAKKYIKMSSTSLIIWKMQIKIQYGITSHWSECP